MVDNKMTHHAMNLKRKFYYILRNVIKAQMKEYLFFKQRIFFFLNVKWTKTNSLFFVFKGYPLRKSL